MSSFYGKSVADTYKTIIHFDESLQSDSLQRKSVYDGQGLQTSVSFGLSGSGLTVTGIISTDSGLLIGGDLTVGGNINFPTQTTINDVKINAKDSAYSLETSYGVAAGIVRLEDTDNNCELIFGNRNISNFKWKVDLGSDDSLNFRRNDEAVPPLYMDVNDGSVHIKDLRLDTPPQINTVPTTPTSEGDILVLGYLIGSNNISLSTVATSGFQKLPSGFIMQWGTSPVTTNPAGTTINFGFAFPNNAINVNVTPIDDYSLGSNYMGGSYAKIMGTSSFKSLIKGSTGTALSGYVNWVAIGW